MRPLLLGLALLGTDAALVAERVAVVCAVSSHPPAAVPLATMALTAAEIYGDCLDKQVLEESTILPPTACPCDSPADSVSHHPSPVWKPP